MLFGLLLATLAPFSPTAQSVPLAVHVQAELAAQAAPFGVLVLLEETRLIAVSRSSEPCVLVLASPERGAMVARTLAPGATLTTYHPPLSLAGLTLEILAAPAGRLTSSGRLALDGAALCLRLQVGERPSSEHPMLVASDRPVLQRAGSLPFPSASAPLHVPIPSPSDKPPGDSPPPVENEPLPPV